MHSSKQFQDLLKPVGGLREVWRVDDVGPDVDHLVKILLADVLDLAELAVLRVVIGVEVSPVQNLIRVRKLGFDLREF